MHPTSARLPRINRFSQTIRFLRVSRLLLWTLWVIYHERRRVMRAREQGNYDVQPNVEVLVKVLIAFRATAVKLGVLMIKLGQFLSSRADLLPEQALAVLASLQDEVPPAPFQHVISVIEQDLGKPTQEVFSALDRTCAAAASFGQVHKATLAATGEQVAVKVQRPNIDQLVRMDLSTLRFVIWVIDRLVNTSGFIDLLGVYHEFKRTVYEEINYITESTNAQRFREMFKDDPTIYIPRVYDEYTSRRVLVLEWIDGIKINDYAALEACGMDRLDVANRTVKAYFHQFFEAGFFHADPHPGNIFVKKEPLDRHPSATSSKAPVIAFVDFGMVGTLTNGMKKSLKDMFLSFVMRDSRGIVNALVRLGFIGAGANMLAIERGMALMLEQYYGMTLGEAQKIDIPDVVREVETLLYGQPFQIPAQFAFTGRAVGTLIGVSTGLAPEFNFVDIATPYARKFLGLDAGSTAETLQHLFDQMLEAIRTMLSLPRAIEHTITRLETGQIEVKLADTGGRSRRGRSRNQSVSSGVRGFPWALMFTASLAGGIILTDMHQVIAGWFCLGLAGITVLGLLIKR